MAITDIQISEELETNAPSIKYSGNEGPKSPQEEQQMMADALLKEEYNNYVYDLLEQRPDATPMSFEEFKMMVIAEGQMSKGPVLPNDPTEPVNPFGPKPIGPVLPDRQMAAYGGIMGLDGRRKYGIGSSLKKFVRKVIPNEVSKVAVKAAPFVAPFNPLAAGLMAGIGGFDQTGRIGSSLKSGLMNYGMGQIARGLGGAGMQEGFNLKINPGAEGLRQYFSSPMAAKTAIGQGVSGSNKALFTSDKAMRPDLGLMEVPGKGVESVVNLSQGQGIDKISPLAQLKNKIMDYVPTSFGDVNPFGENFDIKKAAGAFGIYQLGKKLLGTPKEVEETIMSRGDGLDLDSIRLEVREAFKDPSGKKLAALRNKYPYLGTQASKDIANMAMGGRIGFDNGGIMMASAPSLEDSRNEMSLMLFGKPLHELTDEELEILNESSKRKPKSRVLAQEGGIMDLGGMEKDYRNTGGFVDIGEYEKKDDVPARLSVNEFVMTADAVRGMGDGDIDLGAQRMENLMGAMENKKGAQQMFDVSERLSEVI